MASSDVAKRARVGEKEECPDLPPMVTGGTLTWDRRGESFFSMGEGTLKVPMSMHAGHREGLCKALRPRPDISADAVVLLQGGQELPVYDTDTHWEYKQESNFQYLFGVKEPDCFAAIRVKDCHAVLFVPNMGVEQQKWSGPNKPPAWFQRGYAVTEAAYVEDLAETLRRLGADQLLLLSRGDANRDSGLQLPEPEFEGKDSFKIGALGSQVLWDTINECRTIKSPEEMKLMQYVNDITSTAHVEVMRMAKAGQREHLAAATFKYHAALRGSFRVGYNCICGSGRRNAILHYGHPAEPNAEKVEEKVLRLHDMGAEYHGYSADVTVSFPVSGRFSEMQRLVYEAVWDATEEVERNIRPGVVYKDMHRLAQRVLLERMSSAGLFTGSVDKMMKVDLMNHFMPHGLGHQLGLDVHDVGGYAPGEFKKDDSTLKENLRCGRELKEGMVLTVEPGFYFIDYLIEEALADPVKSAFINKDRLHEFWKDVGGVRIEDDVVVTADGCRVFTVVPRTVDEIEAVLGGAEWQVSQSCCRTYSAKTSP